MRSGLEKRLARLQAPVEWQERVDRLWRVECRGRARMGAFVRECFAEWGIDPARAPILDWADEAAGELAQIADSEELEHADAKALGWDEETAEFCWLADPWILKNAERYWCDHAAEPDFKQTSLAEIVAWCLARLCGDAWFGASTGD